MKNTSCNANTGCIAGRRGIGLFFTIVVSMVVLAAFAGVFQMGFSRHVVSAVEKSALGEIELMLADSAVQEALHEIRGRVNRPDDPIFLDFRKEVYSSESGEFPIDVYPSQINNILSRPFFSRFSLEDFTAKVSFQRQFSHVPYERYGMLCCRATVSTRLGLRERVSRTLEIGCETRVTLLSPPRPFDQVTFMVTDAQYLLRDANYRLDDVKRCFETVRRDRNTIIDLIKSESGNMQHIDPQSAVRRLEQIVILSDGQLKRKVHEFETPIAVFSKAPSVRPSELNLPRLLEDGESRINNLTEQYRRATGNIRGAVNVDDPALVDAYRSAMQALVQAQTERIDLIEKFQNLFVEYTDRNLAGLSSFFFKLDAAEWHNKAHYYIGEEKGDDINKALEDLRKKYDPLNGIVFINNRTQVLALEGARARFSGRLILAVTGEIRAVNTTPGNHAGDMLTLVAFGPVSVEGRCRCSIIANKTLTMNENAVIDGNLVIRSVRDFDSIKGVINRDDRLYSGRTVPGDVSGAFIDYYYVTVAPGETYRLVQRNR